MAYDSAQIMTTGSGTLSNDPANTGSPTATPDTTGTEPRSIQKATTQQVVIASRNLDKLQVEEVSPPPTSRLMSLKRSESMGAERMRLLRMRLWEMRRMSTLNVLAITSALPQDGKSTIAMNLASVLSDGKQHKILVIEADLHCPGIGKSLGIGKYAGFAECLESGSDPFSYIRRIEPMGWYLLPAGSTEAHPTDLVQSRTCPELIASLTPHFDWIILDTPPVFPVADTLSLCHASDAVLLVVRSGVTPKSNVDEAIELIGSNRIAAIILNGAEEINKSYYKYASYYGSKK